MNKISVISRLGVAAMALAGVLALAPPTPAQAAHGGGGFHGGGSGGGFHGGGFHGGGFPGGGFRGAGFPGGFHSGFDGFQAGHFAGHQGFDHRGLGAGEWGVGLGLGAAYPYDYGYGEPDYGAYATGQADASSYWYYCQSPAGYYPYVQQCSVNWQPVPAG